MAYNISIKESQVDSEHTQRQGQTAKTSLSLESTTSSTDSTPAPSTPTETPSPSLPSTDSLPTQTLQFGKGSVRYHHLDAELISPNFPPSTYNIVWISEALSHLPNKQLFFKHAYTLLKPGGRLVIADWVKAPGLSAEEEKGDIEPIERGMLLPPLGTMGEYEEWARDAGLVKVGEGMDISEQVKKTW
jgi:SAM-dependent methyltransferase